MENLRRRKVFGPPPKPNQATTSEPEPNLEESKDKKPSAVRKTKLKPRNMFRSSAEFLVLFGSLVYIVWLIYKTHNSLPQPKDREVPKAVFSEDRAQMAMTVLGSLGCREFSSMILEFASADTKMLLKHIKTKDVPKTVDMEMEWHVAKSGWIPYEGKSVIYDSLRNLVVRLSPKGKPEAKENAILVSTHIDSIKFTVGAGDSLSNIATMIELVRNMAQIADQFVNSIIFLFNTGEEEGLMGAHAFIRKHRWASTIRSFVNLEAMGVGGPSVIFQGYPSGWLVKEFCKVAPYPATAIIAQDVFHTGLIGSMTDFQVYHKEGNLSGLDFAFTENAGVYHTKFDQVSLIRDGSIQHLGDNLNALLKSVAKSPELANQTPGNYPTSRNEVIYFDILGKFMFVVSASAAQIVYLIVASQAFLTLAPIVVGPKTGQPTAFFLALFTIFLTLFFGILFPFIVGYILPFVCVHPIPYLDHKELIFGLFGAPAFAGALIGQMIGRRFLCSHLTKKSERKEREEKEKKTQKDRREKFQKSDSNEVNNMKDGNSEEVSTKEETINSVEKIDGGEKENGCKSSGETGKGGEGEGGGGDYESLQQKYEKNLEKEYLIEWETERWLYVGGLVLWLILMLVSASMRLGTAFFACVWLLFPALSYGALQSNKIGEPPSCGLKVYTFLIGILIPILTSTNLLLRIPAVLVSMMGRIDKNPGSVEPWQANGVVAVMVGLLFVITIIYLLPLAHRGGGAPILVFLSLLLTSASILIVAFEGVPAFSEKAPKEIVAVSLYPDLTELKGQRVDWRQLANASRNDLPAGILSIASFTPGNISKEVQVIEGLECSSLDIPDFVTFDAKYACSAGIQLPSNIGVKLVGYHYFHSFENSVTELEVLSDVGRNSVGADKWREGIAWWGGKVRENDVDEWEEWREEKGKEGQEMQEAGNGRVTRVGIKTGLSRRWNLAVDATRIRAFSIGVVNGTFRKYAFRKIEPEEKWHQIAVRVRYDYFSWVNKFIIKLYWRRYVRKGEKSRPLLRIRSDIQDCYPSEVDKTHENVLNQLPSYMAQFGKSSLPTSQAFVDVLYLD